MRAGILTGTAVAVWATSGGVALAGPMDPSDPTPRLLDNEQFAVLALGMAMVVALLSAILVGVWRR